MIISKNGAGLCNRIKCWVSSMRIDEECYVDWPNFVRIRPTGITVDNIPQPKRKSFPKFEELFENVNKLPERKAHSRYINYSRPDDVLNCPFYKSKDAYKTYSDCKFVVFPEDNVDRNFIKKQLSEKSIIDLQFHRTPTNVLDDYKDLFKKIKFKQYIVDIAEKFYLENMSDKKIMTVHVRSFPTSPLRTQRWYNINNYFSVIDKLQDKFDLIFLSTDSLEIDDKFKKRYKNKIIIFDKKTDPMRDFGTLENQIEAIVDLLLLGKGETLLATETSTYSEVAWWLAECKPNVIKVGNIIYE